MFLDETELLYYFKDKYGYSETRIEEEIKKKPKIRGPLAYAIGYSMFLDSKIDLRYKPLIPRPETEYWVYKVIENLTKQNESRNKMYILDMFAGSGCIGIAILRHINNAHVTFVDISNDAIKQIKLNLDINGIEKRRYEIVKSDIFSELPKSKKFTLILANPPYVSVNDNYGTEILAEPHEALFAKDNGMYVIKKFLDNSLGYIAENGTIYMEIGENQKKDISKHVEDKPIDINFQKDQYGKIRVVKIKKTTI